jgi:nucleoid-associated protein YgaU
VFEALAVSHRDRRPAPVHILGVEQAFDRGEVEELVATRRSGHQWEIERAVRVHPAGSALRRGATAPAASRPDRPADRAGSGGGGPVRLTARGRRLVAALGLTAGLGVAGLACSAVQGGSGNGLHLAGQSSVVVRPGDTVWSVASSVAGDQDVRVVVDRIQDLNRLHGSDLVPGQVLRLP